MALASLLVRTIWPTLDVFHMSYADKDLDALRETGKTERFYAERAGTAVPGIVRLVERLDAAEAVCRAIETEGMPDINVQELLADWHESAGR
jgi:hypothetical protein